MGAVLPREEGSRGADDSARRGGGREGFDVSKDVETRRGGSEATASFSLLLFKELAVSAALLAARPPPILFLCLRHSSSSKRRSSDPQTSARDNEEDVSDDIRQAQSALSHVARA